MFTDRERATVLAALRLWQCRGPVTTNRPASPLSAETWWLLHDIATDCGILAPLKDNEIDQVCERLNVPLESRKPSLRSFRRKLVETMGRWASFIGLRGSLPSFKPPAYCCRLVADNESKISADQTELDDSYCDCQLPGFFCSGVPGIVAHVENGRLSATAKVERCDACLRYPSDEAALKRLRKLGF